MSVKETLKQLESEKTKVLMAELYGAEKAEENRARYRYVAERFEKTGVFQGNGLGAALFFFLYGLPFWRLLCNRCVLPPFCPWRWKNRLDAPERLCSGCGGAGL